MIKMVFKSGNIPHNKSYHHIVCKVCNAVFPCKPYILERRKNVYCSKLCWQHATSMRKLSLETRKKLVVAKSKQRRYGTDIVPKYTRQQIVQSQTGQKRPIISGEKNPNWRGGVSHPNDALRKTRQYKNWRESVFTRDKYTCQNCQQHGEILNAHHILPFATFPQFRFNKENGITLCEKCHHKGQGEYFERQT